MKLILLFSFICLIPTQAIFADLSQEATKNTATAGLPACTKCSTGLRNAIEGSDSELKKFCMDCLAKTAKGAQEAAYDATFGLVDTAVAASKAVGNCILSPIECAQSVAVKTKNFIAGMGDIIDKIREAIPGITLEEAGLFACHLVGNLGTNALIALMTGGMASAKILASIVGMIDKLAELAPVMTSLRAMRVPLDALTDFSSSSMEKIKNLIQSGKGKEVEMAFSACSI